MGKIIIDKNTPRETKGCCSALYFISNDIVVKIPNNHLPDYVAEIEDEFQLHEKIWKNRKHLIVKRPVPTPLGIEDIYFDGYAKFPGLLMQRIHGYDLEDCPFLKRYFLMKRVRKLEKDIGKKLGLGINTHYNKLEPRNAMFDETINDVKIVDFGCWGYLN